MKIGRFGMELLKTYLTISNKKAFKNHPPRDAFRSRINIPYIDDGSEYHTYDVYLADESNRKHCCILDIHGGSYIFGNHRYNYPYAYYLLKAGFDVVLLDYAPNDGKKDIYDLFKDVCLNMRHLKNRLEEYGLADDTFVISGDSAGGHIALLISTAMQCEDVSKATQLNVDEFDIRATVVSCPVYDFANLPHGALKSNALERMLGPRYNDIRHLEIYSARTYINQHRLPLFVSTSNHDFLRSESLMLAREVKDKENFKLVDIKTENKEANHVHNVTKIDLPESIEVNNAIIEFIDDIINK